MNKKIAVVTGANRGLGLGTSEALAKQGYHVVMVGRDATKIDRAAAELKSKKLDVEAFEADVSNPADIQKLASKIKKDFGHLDALVNNAGVYLEAPVGSGGNSSIFDVSSDKIVETFEINTLGPLRLTQALASCLRESKAGRVVNVSSGMGQLSEMSGSAASYRISKTALNAVTRIFSVEFSGSPVKVNSVCPGWVKTDMGGAGAHRTIEEGISGIVWAATLPEDGPTGGFFRDGKKLDW